MRRVSKAEQQADRERAHFLFLLQAADRCDDLFLVQRQDHASIGGDSFADASAPAAWRQEDRGLGVHKQVIHTSAPEASDLEAVFEPISGDDGGRGAATLEDRICADGRPVHESLDVRWTCAGKPERSLRAGTNPVDQAGWRGRNFGRVVAAGVRIDYDDVCEGPADVDREEDHVRSYFVIINCLRQRSPWIARMSIWSR